MSDTDTASDTEDEPVSEIEQIQRPIEKIIYYVKFSNGYIFRQALEFYKELIIHSIPLYFKEEDISIITGSGNQKDNRHIISTMDLVTDNISKYFLDPDLVNIEGDEETESCFAEQLNIDLLKSVLKSMQKGCKVCMFRTTISDLINIEIKTTGIVKSAIKSGELKNREYKLSGFRKLPKKPNVRIDTTEFNSTLKGLGKDVRTACFKVFPKGLHLSFYNSSSEKNSIKEGSFGENIPEDIEEADEESYYKTVISGSTIKSFLKIHNICPNSVLKITSGKNGYLQIRHNVYDFGEHKIYIIGKS